ARQIFGVFDVTPALQRSKKTRDSSLRKVAVKNWMGPSVSSFPRHGTFTLPPLPGPFVMTAMGGKRSLGRRHRKRHSSRQSTDCLCNSMGWPLASKVGDKCRDGDDGYGGGKFAPERKVEWDLKQVADG